MKFHPDDCIHKVELDGGPFWGDCSRHGNYYFLCHECSQEELKDSMVEHGYLSADEVIKLINEHEFCECCKNFLEWLKLKQNEPLA